MFMTLRPGFRASIVADLFVISAGVWSAYALVCVYTGQTFGTVVRISWVPAIGWLLMSYAVLRSPSLDGPREETYRTDLRYTNINHFLLAFVGVLALLWYIEWIQGWALWLGAIAYLGVLIGPNREAFRAPRIGGSERLDRDNAFVLLLVALVAIVVTLGANRPDADDAYYVNVAVSAIERPNLPILAFDGMHGEAGLPLLNLAHRPQTFEILIGVIATLTGAEVITIYYVGFPVFFACMFAISQWLLLKLIDHEAAAMGLIVTLIVFVAWGEGHRTYGNFSFVRLYQGKAVFVCVLVPLILYYALQFCRHTTWQNWMFLMFAEIGAVAFTSSALVLGPICASLGLLSGLEVSKSGLKKFLSGASASLPNFVVLTIVAMEYRQAGSAFGEVEILSIRHVLGESVRAPLALIGILCLPLVAIYLRRPSAAWVSRFVFLAFFLIFNKITAFVLAEMAAKNFSWRLYWVVPVPTLLAGLVGMAFVGGWRRWKATGEKKFRAISVGSLLACGLFLSLGRWSLSPNNKVEFIWAGPKIAKYDLALARTVLSLTPPGGMVLAPDKVSRHLTRFPHPPRLVIVRRGYLDLMAQHWGAEETKTRKELGRFIAGTSKQSDLDRWVVEEVGRRGVTTVVCAKETSQRDEFRRGMLELGFAWHSDEAYDIWFKKGPDGQ